MKNISNRTKSMKRKYHLCSILSFICTIAPLIIYVIIGFVSGEIHTSHKVFLGFTCVMAIMLTSLNILLKYKLRSPLFILLLGIYYALNNILSLIIIISIGIVMDEFIFSPLKKKYKIKAMVNTELDIREGE